MVLIIKEIKNDYWFNKLVKFIIRCKDDILFIPKIKVGNENECNDNIINKLYSGFEFEYEMSKESVDVGDITMKIENGKISTTTLNNKDKIVSYIKKSSNVKQNLNGIFKTWCHL